MKKSSLILALIFYVCAAPAQNVDEKTGSLLWKISGNGLKNPSYIFGTHHGFSSNFLDSIAGVKQAFASCDQMVGELVFNDMPALAAELQKAGAMPKDTTWQMLLSADDYQFVDKKLTSLFGTGLQTFGNFKPSMVSMTYAAMLYQKMFPNMSSGDIADMWFQQQAAGRTIPIVGLETVQDQIDAIINVVPLKQQAADLICTLQNADHSELSAKKLNKLYRSADLTGLIEMLREDSPCQMSSQQEVALNDARNERWLKKLPALFAEKSTFVAVGCLHLAGKAGLLAGLEQAGYTVEAVRE